MKTKDKNGRTHDPAGRFAIDPAAPSHAYATERWRLLRERARIARLQRRELQSRLVLRADVEAERRSELRLIRRRLQRVPDAVVARLPGVKTAAEAERIMREEIYQALTDISRTQVLVRKPRASRHRSA